MLSEVYLCFSAYNLLRMVSIFGMEVLKKKLEALVLSFSCHMAYFAIHSGQQLHIPKIPTPKIGILKIA